MAAGSLTCPVYHRPLSGTLRLVDGFLSVKCRACGGIHLVSRLNLNTEWDTLEQQKTDEQEAHTPAHPVGASR